MKWGVGGLGFWGVVGGMVRLTCGCCRCWRVGAAGGTTRCGLNCEGARCVPGAPPPGNWEINVLHLHIDSKVAAGGVGFEGRSWG